MSNHTPKQKVIILGGGVAGCTTAYWLTHSQDLRDKYEVHLYQSGWRLGGKGASGRDPKTKKSYEHGPHAWYGGYENGFRMLHDIYRSYFDRYGSHGKFTDFFGTGDTAVFRPATESAYFDAHTSQVWKWIFPPESLGQDGDGSPPPDLWTCIKRIWTQLKDNIAEEKLTQEFALPANTLLHNKHLEADTTSEINLIDLTEKFIYDAFEYGDHKHQTLSSSDWIIELFSKKLKNLINHTVGRKPVTVMLDFMFTLTVGTIRDIKLGNKQFDDLNGEDFQQWLERHHAHYPSAADNPYVNGLYDAAFAFKDGKTRDLAAGTALRISLWILFGYKSNFIYKMQAGMGEVVFTPFYKILCEGHDGEEPFVQTHFFHRVTDLELDPDGKRITNIKMLKQANPIGDYNPLIDAKLDHENQPFWCWPDTPKWDDLENGAELSQLDEPGVDMESRWTRVGISEENMISIPVAENDIVVFAMPAPVLPELCNSLSQASPRFAQMVDSIDSVQTAALQLWIDKAPQREGDDGSISDEHGLEEEMIMGGAANPLSINLDYSPILSTESHETSEPQQLLYSCGITPDQHEDTTPDPHSDTPQQLRDTLGEQVTDWLQKTSPILFKSLSDENGEFHWERIGGVDFLEKNYHRVNFDGHSRYILSTANSIKHRLHPNESGFDNLILAGDWTKTGIDLGCVEAAVISGMLAVEAITAEDLDIKIPLG